MYRHSKIRKAFQKVQLQLCSTLTYKRTTVTPVPLRLRKEEAPPIQTDPDDFMRIGYVWLNFARLWFDLILLFVWVFFNDMYYVKFCHLQGERPFCACSCLFHSAAAQDVECVQLSSCLQGRTLDCYSVWLRPTEFCQDPELFIVF